MDCKQWKERLVGMLYDELEPAERALTSEHLEQCESCRADLARLEGGRELLRASAPVLPDAPPLVVLEPRRRPAWYFAAGALAASLLIGATLAAVLLATRNAPAGPDPALLRAEIARAVADARDSLDNRLTGLEQRVDSLPQEPAAESMLTRAQLDEALDERFVTFERRVGRAHARDVGYLMEEIAATQYQTGTRLNRSEEAIHLLAARQDPRFTEQ